MDAQGRALLVVNLHGGIPGALVERALSQLDAFRQLRACSTTFPRATAVGVDPHAAFRHAITGAGGPGARGAPPPPPGGAPPETIFSQFKRHGFRTELRGVFGLRPSLDRRGSVDPVWDATEELRTWGIDRFETRDAYFDGEGTAVEHDAQVFARAEASVHGWAHGESHLLFLNCVGCADVSRLAHAPPTRPPAVCPIRIGVDEPASYAHRFERDAIRPNVPFAAREQMERYVPSSVLDDHVRDPSSRARRLPAVYHAEVHRHAQLGVDVDGAPAASGERLDGSLCAHALAWRYLRQLDRWLADLLHAVRERGRHASTSVVLVATQGIGLMEHGSVRSMPWESCLRSLLVVHKARQTYADTWGHSLSLAHLGALFFWACDLPAQWGAHAPCMLPPTIHPAVSTQLALSSITRHGLAPDELVAFPGFCIRAKVFCERWYAVAVWLSINALGRAFLRGGWDALSAEQRVASVEHVSAPNPALGASLWDICRSEDMLAQVYDHMTDAEELVDLATDDAWLQSRAAAAAKAEFDAAVRAELGESVWVNDTPGCHAAAAAAEPAAAARAVVGGGHVVGEEPPTLGELLEGAYGGPCASIAAHSLAAGVATVLAFVLERAEPLGDLWPVHLPLPVEGAISTQWRGEIAVGAVRIALQPERIAVNGRAVSRVEHVRFRGGVLTWLELADAAGAGAKRGGTAGSLHGPAVYRGRSSSRRAYR